MMIYCQKSGTSPAYFKSATAWAIPQNVYVMLTVDVWRFLCIEDADRSTPAAAAHGRSNTRR